jgi:hypothetical protein
MLPTITEANTQRSIIAGTSIWSMFRSAGRVSVLQWLLRFARGNALGKSGKSGRFDLVEIGLDDSDFRVSGNYMSPRPGRAKTNLPNLPHFPH